MLRTFLAVFSFVFLTGISGCSEERLPRDLPSDDGPISLTGGAI